ncbi:restriction endonuclease subunit S [Staphylococcus felis]|uniref:restriction endonuclease subunit S n=1 Tax=Staphylococcus felis TaxID=46127 RepID=UPI0027FDD6FA|nr:restriction endonuclease subunit S [Staphylococcus felis]
MLTIDTLIRYSNGSLLTRLEEVTTDGVEVPIYDHVMMSYDKGVFHHLPHEPKWMKLPSNHKGKIVQAGQIVMNMMTTECVIVSERHEGSILPYNYTLIEIDETRLDSQYLAYWFNMSSSAQAQLNQFMQGGSLVKKLTLNHLKQIKIQPPPLEKQKLIGRIAACRKRQKYLYQKKQYLMDQFLVEQLLREEY